MDIFQILREAKNPSGPKKTKRNNNLPDDLDVDDNDSPPEDATEGVDDGTSALDDDQDVNEQNDTKDKDETSDDTTPDDLDVDDNDSPPEDATEGVDDGTSALDDDQDANDNQDNEQPEDTPEEDSNENTDESENNAALLRDSINLYYNIKQNIDKIDKLSYNNNLINKTNIQVKQNLSKLLEYLYDFITIRFKKNKYIDNLYMYDYFIEAYKINVEILKKISSFGEND